MTNRMVLVAGLLSGLALPASADDLSAGAFIAMFKMGTDEDRLLSALTIDGNVSGLSSANAYLGSKGAKQIYCPPDQPPLEAMKAKSILENFVEKHPAKGEEPVGPVLLQALQEAYPCR